MLKAIWDASANRRYAAPALNFEAQTGIEGVGRTYKMPNGISMEYMESLLPGTDFSLFQMKHVVPTDERFRFSWAMAAEQVVPLATTMETKYQKLIDTLCDLNPELKNIKFDQQNKSDRDNFLWGVTSGFNPDDIQHFLDRSHRDPAEIKQEQLTGIWPQLKRRCDEIFGKEQHLVQWVPSPATAAHINEQLDRRYGPDPLLSLAKEEQERVLKEVSLKAIGEGPTLWQKASLTVRSALSMPRALSE